MNFEESKDRYMGSFGGKKGMEKLYNYITIAKNKKNQQVKRISLKSHSGSKICTLVSPRLIIIYYN